MINLLPTFEDLSAEQEHVYRLPLDSCSLVSGPPGTGKTVLALYRAQRLKQTAQGFQLLTFSKLLKQYIAAAAATLSITGEVRTYHSFMLRWWRSKGQRGYAPQVARFDYDWGEIYRALEAKPRTGTYRHLIVDEAQDLPKEFWGLMPWVAPSVTVFADENQRITETNSRLSEIIGYAGIGEENHHALTRNYRNTKQIHAVGVALIGGTGALEPKEIGDVPEVIRFDRDSAEADFIARLAKNRPDWQIGVLAPSEKARARLVNQIAHRVPEDVAVQTYNWKLGGGGHKVDWSKAGVYVVNWESAKGLQFDHVFLPRLEQANKDPEDETTRMMLYVMITRARTGLTASWTGAAGGSIPAIAQLLPKDCMDWDIK